MSAISRIIVFTLLTVTMQFCWAEDSTASFTNKKFQRRGGFLCEPQLLKRRIAEAGGRHKEFLKAVSANVATIYMKGGGRCSGTFITPNCILTAAHCFASNPFRGVSAIQPKTRKRLIGGTGHQFPGYTYLGIDQKFVKHRDKGDTGIVRFNKPWPGFKPITVWYFAGNEDFWIYDWDSKTPSVNNPKLLNRKFWSDFGVLGLTAYAPKSVSEPNTVAQCTDSHFGWAPEPYIATKKGASNFRRGTVSMTGDSGPGMSGGAVYDLYGILGTIEGSPSTAWASKKKLPKIPGTSYRLGNAEDLRPGYGSSFVMIEPGQAKFIRNLCPNARLLRRAQLKGGRVAKQGSRDLYGYIGSKSNPWSKLDFSARQTHVSRSMKPNDTGLFVTRLQNQLRRLGYLKQKSNGKYDKATQNAVKKFQFDKQLKETGHADIWTLKLMQIMLE